MTKDSVKKKENPDPTLALSSNFTLERMMKASGSRTNTSLFSVPMTRQLTPSSSAVLFFRVPMQVMTV